MVDESEVDDAPCAVNNVVVLWFFEFEYRAVEAEDVEEREAEDSGSKDGKEDDEDGGFRIVCPAALVCRNVRITSSSSPP